MRNLPFILGVVAAMVGLVGWLFSAAYVQPWNWQTGLGAICVLVGLAAAIDSRAHPVWNGAALLTVGLLGFLAIGLFWLIPLPLFMTAGVLSLVGARRSIALA